MKLLIADGLSVKVDDTDYETLKQYVWHVKQRTNDHLYVYRYVKRSDDDLHVSRFRCVRLHRELMGFPKLTVDHENGDTLDNQRHNLRVATQQQQAMNTRHRNGKQYKGVTKIGLIHGKYQSRFPWHARLRINNKLISLGYYATPEGAAVAYNQAASRHFGVFACLNKVTA